MTDLRAGPVREREAGGCVRRFHFEDVDMYCADNAIPGGRLCAGCLIESQARRAEMRRFRSRAVKIEEVPG
jgi:hypothetical protein